MTELDQSPEPTQAPITPGTLLSQARERAGISQEQVARELHITVTKVKSIENDDYLRLNTDTFIRGYLRAYANFLKLDSAPIISAYLQHAASQGLATEPQYPVSKEAPTRKLWVFVVLLILLLAGLWLISVWFFDNQTERPVVAPASTVPQTPVPAIAVAPVTLPAAEIDEAIDEEVIAEEGAVPVAAVESQAPVSTQENTERVVPSAERMLDRLQLTFAEECWLEVSDAQGDVLATELQRPGSSVSLQGVAPFSVKLGNAAAAKILLNGNDVAVNSPAGAKVVTINVGE